MIPTLTTRWFYRNIGGKAAKIGPHTCAVCGLQMSDGEPLKSILRNTFSNFDLLRCRKSDVACPACCWYFGRQDLRRSSWWLTPTQAVELSKDNWLPLIQEHIECGAPEDAYYLLKKPGLAAKHLALYAKMTLAGERTLNIQFNDDASLAVDESTLIVYDAAAKLREFHSWPEIVTGDFYPHRILKWPDIMEFKELCSIIALWRNTPILGSVTYKDKSPRVWGLIPFLWRRKENGE